MRYTVIWMPDAQDQLAEIWIAAANRRAVTAAADLVDLILATDPDTKGSDFYGDRYLAVPPIRVVFRIVPDDMLVEVTMVW